MLLDYKVPAIDRAVQILEILSESPNGISLAELTHKTKIPKSTLFRILFTMQRYSIVSEDKERKVFSLGMKLIQWGNAALDKIDLKSIAHPHLVTLAYETKESLYLTVMENYEIIIIDRVDTPEVWGIVARLGTRSPFHCTATGQVITAGMHEEDLEHLIKIKGLKKYTSKTITSATALRKKLKKVREERLAICDREYKDDLIAIAVPIFEHSGRVIASLMTAIQANQSKNNKKTIEYLGKTLQREGENISRKLGFNQPY
jgi:IclR family transcriptional regulator, KDG regulon repressor